MEGWIKFPRCEVNLFISTTEMNLENNRSDKLQYCFFFFFFSPSPSFDRESKFDHEHVTICSSRSESRAGSGHDFHEIAHTSRHLTSPYITSWQCRRVCIAYQRRLRSLSKMDAIPGAYRAFRSRLVPRSSTVVHMCIHTT